MGTRNSMPCIHCFNLPMSLLWAKMRKFCRGQRWQRVEAHWGTQRQGVKGNKDLCYALFAPSSTPSRRDDVIHAPLDALRSRVTGNRERRLSSRAAGLLALLVKCLHVCKGRLQPIRIHLLCIENLSIYLIVVPCLPTLLKRTMEGQQTRTTIRQRKREAHTHRSFPYLRL